MQIHQNLPRHASMQIHQALRQHASMQIHHALLRSSPNRPPAVLDLHGPTQISRG
ncbi:hypothetical protein T492DRAFT_1016453 [Pavlovales sp. CCMP2436]|nr:hypothetical protein T492DRAFT_1016453 [Pavlovales sp. CCMP2436]